jgi:Fic family protein
LRGVTEQAQDAIQRAKQLQDLRANWPQSVLTPRASGIMLKLIDRLFETPILSAVDIQTHFKVSHQTAMSSIKRLAQLGILKEITGKHRNRMYIAEKIMTIIE